MRTKVNIYDELKWRGLINQVSDEDKVRAYLSEPGATMYCGFDPTAESLHVGNLVPLLCLVRMKKAGHNPLYLMGGATGRIGDPSGKDKERELSDADKLDERLEMIKRQVRRFVERNTGERPDIVNNYDWTKDMTCIELLRDVGKHFTINWMLQKESVKGRIDREETGISYTEFSYMILQSYDFYHLYKNHDCRLQIGGGDQWGNITAGSGKKFGKSEGNAVYLNADLTTPYAFYQFFINTDDADVIKFLKLFTFLTPDEIAEMERQVAEEPHLRAAQKRLAEEVTAMIHGKHELERVLAATEALFGKGDIKAIDPATLRSAFESAPAVRYAPGDLPDLPQMLMDLGLVKSKGQARKDIQGGGIYVNGERVEDGQDILDAHFIGGELLIIRKGKKNYGLVTKG
jgi:tyrosyl-tRNA synthetase